MRPVPNHVWPQDRPPPPHPEDAHVRDAAALQDVREIIPGQILTQGKRFVHLKIRRPDTAAPIEILHQVQDLSDGLL